VSQVNKNDKSSEKSTNSGGAVIGADYIDEFKLVATTANNNSINFWDCNNYIFRERICTSEIQMTGKKYFLCFSQVVWSSIQ
jgi:hypothetical protein